MTKPDILLLVGNISNKTLLDTQTGITKLRGQWQSYEADGLSIPALPLLHPAYVLRRPETKADMWADLCLLQKDWPADALALILARGMSGRLWPCRKRIGQ